MPADKSVKCYLMIDINSLYSKFLNVGSVSTDTRKITPGSIFFALKGPSFNGNAFASKALELGSSYVVIDEGEALDERYLKVDDVLSTLQQLASHHRKQLGIPVIAIVGSNGKTTTKELLNSVLSTRFKVLATPGNFNNHIGLPLTLLMLDESHYIAVIEMGANHEGENALLCEIALPDYGIVTNNGKDHLEGFGSIEGVIRSNSELYSYLAKHNGTAFVNAYDDTLMHESEQVDKRITYSGISPGRIPVNADFSLLAEILQPTIRFSMNGETTESILSGDYNFDNITAAICIGHHFGLTSTELSKGVSSYQPANLRSQWIQKKQNTIFLDAYNANPSSMELSIRNFMGMPQSNKLLILGDMFEMGVYEAQEHQALVNWCLQFKQAEFWLVGKAFTATQSDFRKFASTEDVAIELQNHPLTNRLVFLKGSRGMKLESLIDSIE